MPDLTSPIHTDMLREYKQQRRPSLPRRLWRAVQHELRAKDYYGQQWGDPDGVAALSFINGRWVQPYVQSDKTGLEIGPGGGRWTRYLLGFEKLYVVDHYPELLAELRKTCAQPNMVFVLNNGTDFPSVPDAAVDYLFSFGVFVHLDVPLIESYLSNMKRVLKHWWECRYSVLRHDQDHGPRDQVLLPERPGDDAEVSGGCGLSYGGGRSHNPQPELDDSLHALTTYACGPSRSSPKVIPRTPGGHQSAC